jgi:Putative Flp pilus-assembly TadE/G-like
VTIKLCKEFLSDRSGHFAVSFGLTFLPVVFVAGLALDYGDISSERARLQQTADSAAIFAAKELERPGYSESDLLGEVGSLVASSFNVESGVTADVELDPVANTITVDLSRDYSPSFLQLMRPGSFTMNIRSRAGYEEVGGIRKCVVALSATGKGVLSFNGHANIDARNCGVHVNSASPDSVDLSDGGTIRSQNNCFVGGIGSAHSDIDPQPGSHCRQLPDLFTGIAAPSAGAACDHRDLKVQGDHKVVLEPGIYCGGLDIGSGTALELESGLYIIRDGRFKTNGSVQMNGENVTLYFVGDAAALQLSADTDFHLTAMDKGPLAGFIVYFDQSAKSDVPNAFSGGDRTYFEGLMYYGYHDLDITLDGEVNSRSPYSAIVANRIGINGNGTLRFAIDPDATALPIPAELSANQIQVRLID